MPYVGVCVSENRVEKMTWEWGVDFQGRFPKVWSAWDIGTLMPRRCQRRISTSGAPQINGRRFSLTTLNEIRENRLHRASTASRSVPMISPDYNSNPVIGVRLR